MSAHLDAERFEPASLEDWSHWLADHHASSAGVWLVTAKRSTGRQAFGYEEGVIEALRYGWVDATKRTVDAERSMLWFTARRAGSGWAATNKRRIAELEAAGRLEPAGRAVVEAARADGSWTLLDDVENLVVPDDLAAALDVHPGARASWDGFAPSVRRAMLGWLVQAKRPQTRRQRIEEIVAGAAQGAPVGPARPRG